VRAARAAGTAEWVYDSASGAGIGKLAAMVSAPDPKLKAPCTVANTTQTSGNRAGRWFTYDEFGNVQEATECTDGENFVTTYGYDSFGRQSLVTYPAVGDGSRFAAEYRYNKAGFLYYVADGSDHKPCWVATAMNAAGQVTGEQTRNGVVTSSTRNPATGWLLGTTATSVANNSAVIQDLAFTYDEVGNLQKRTRAMTAETADSTEKFGYDLLDRLTSAETKIPSAANYDVTESYAYDSIGNLTQKGGKTYAYSGCPTGGPHAVCTVGESTGYSYDQNGNMVAGNGRTLSYNSFNKVTSIAGGPDGSSATVDFMYGADGHRYRGARDL